MYKLFLVAGAILAGTSVNAATLTLSNVPGDGSVTVTVDGYGAFGSSTSPASDAIFDPPGALGPAGTVYGSGIAFRSAGGATEFLSEGGVAGSDALGGVGISGNSASASSSFSYGGISFVLTQTLVPLFDGGTRVGTELVQTYVMTNTSAAAQTFDLIRYVDGDLYFDGSRTDGGGRLTGSREILFETDSATGTADEATFVGISATGGTAPTSGRYEIDVYSALSGKIRSGGMLDDSVYRDGADSDQFIDAGNGYDVALALMNSFSLAIGASQTYVTSTIFGRGAPDDIIVSPVPEPGALGLLGLGILGVAIRRRR